VKIALVFILSLVASLVSFIGEARADIVRGYLLNPEMRYERSSSQDLENRSPRNFSVGYQHLRFSALIEYAQYSETSGNATYEAKRDHQEMTAWFRYHVLGWTFGDSSQTLQAYAGAGAGGYKESVTTNFMTESRVDSSDIKFMSGLSIGTEYSVRMGESFLFVAGLEGRALVSADFDPNPLWSGVLRLGIGYIL
jgi:hypothetical protein